MRFAAGDGRSRRRVLEGSLVAAGVSGAPSTLHAVLSRGGGRGAAAYVIEATRAIGTVFPPGRPDLLRGTVLHLAISLGVGEALALTLPERRSWAWGAAAGFGVGVLNVGLIGRAFPAIRALPLAPQLADNALFGVVFALVADR